jgi:hypothetical protein
VVSFAEREPYMTLSEVALILYKPYTITNLVGENDFESSIPRFLFFHPIFNVELLQPYFTPLLDTSDAIK